MICIKEKSECCGCYGCMNICPKGCIEMKADEEGFNHPEVNIDKCIDCGLCEKVCPTISNLRKIEFKSIAYACKNKNDEVRLESSSGGVFTNLCEYVIENKGVVFGAAFNNQFKVQHMEATTLEECKKFRGSKYVQSEIGYTYKNAKSYLDKGKMVLFSGTQCQIKGLNLFLRKQYENLITVDVVCHGVPSPLVFDMYKENLKKKYNSEIKDINFRDKNKGWKKFSFSTVFSNGEQYSKLLNEDVYMMGFLRNLYLRYSCHDCKSKNFTNGSDISLGDYWGIQNIHKELDDDKGISLVLINSEKGQDIINKIGNSIEIISTDLDYAISQNPCIIKPVEAHNKRNRILKKLNSNNIEKKILKNMKVTLFERIINKFKSFK